MRSDTLLRVAVLATGAFGAVLVLAPATTRAGFGWLLYGDPGRLDAFGAEAVAYVTLLHGVLGAVMIGWAVALWESLGAAAGAGPGFVRRVVARSIGTWYVVDSLFSASQGAWPNVALNTGFALLFAAALWATTRPALGGTAGDASDGRDTTASR